MRLTTHGLFGISWSATSCGLLLAAIGAGCGGDPTMDMPMDAVCTEAQVTGTDSKYATSRLLLPKSTGAMAYAYDLDGDGKTENQLKTLISAVTLAGLDLQGDVDKSVAGGNAVILADLKTADLMSSACSGLTLSLAKAPAAMAPLPKFDGSDTFEVGTVMGIKLFGKIDGGKLNTLASSKQDPTNEQHIELQLPIGNGALLPLAIRGVHIEATIGMDKGQPVLQNGAIHGVISKKDIDGKIVPTVATLISKMINDKPTDSNTMTIISLFEDQTKPASMAKCAADMNKCCHTNPAKCVILPAEVMASAIGGVLSPDVQTFDDNDAWHPVPGGKGKNGMSLGLGFTGIKASF